MSVTLFCAKQSGVHWKHSSEEKNMYFSPYLWFCQCLLILMLSSTTSLCQRNICKKNLSQFCAQDILAAVPILHRFQCIYEGRLGWFIVLPENFSGCRQNICFQFGFLKGPSLCSCVQHRLCHFAGSFKTRGPFSFSCEGGQKSQR